MLTLKLQRGANMAKKKSKPGKKKTAAKRTVKKPSKKATKATVKII